jgi:hypothetical protein
MSDSTTVTAMTTTGARRTADDSAFTSDFTKDPFSILMQCWD